MRRSSSTASCGKGAGKLSYPSSSGGIRCCCENDERMGARGGKGETGCLGDAGGDDDAGGDWGALLIVGLSI